MNVFITTGTYDYLKALKNKFPDEKMILMENENGALLFHETEKKTVFKEPRKYEILESTGIFNDSGLVVMNNIHVTDEGRPLFEYQFKNRERKVEKEPGFLAIRILRPLSSNTYIIMTVWKDEDSFKGWQNSESYKKAHQKSDMETQTGPKMLVAPPYLTKYFLTELADE